MRKKTGIRTYRLITLFMATMLIVAAPLLNSVFQIDFIQGWYQSISIGNLWFVSPLEGIESIIT
jgi:ferredoxin-type protein NapH